MYAVRWLSGTPCHFRGTNNPSLEESLRWEWNPNEEVSVEIIHPSVGSFNTWRFGLVVDPYRSELTRVYAEDANTNLQPDGTLRSSTVDEDELWGDYVDSGWENAEKVYSSIPLEEREGWCEGVVKSPHYYGIAMLEGQHMDIMTLTTIHSIFGELPIVFVPTVQSGEEVD